MQIKSINVSFGVTKNIGNYESLRLEEGCTAILDKCETATEAYDKALDYLKEKVVADINKLTTGLKSKGPNHGKPKFPFPRD